MLAAAGVILGGTLYSVEQFRFYILDRQNTDARNYLRKNVYNQQRIEEFMMENFEELTAMLVPEEVPEVHYTELDKKKFFKEYLTKSKPVLVKEMAQEWPAYKLWKDEAYLMETAGAAEISVERAPRHKNEFAYFETEFGKMDMTYAEFLKRVRDPDRDANYYFAEE